MVETRSRRQYDRDVFYYDSFRVIFQRQLKLEKGNSVVNQRDSEHLCRLVSNVEWSWNRCSVCFFGIFALLLSCCAFAAAFAIQRQQKRPAHITCIVLDVLGLVQTLRALQRRPEDRNSETFAIVCSLV